MEHVQEYCIYPFVEYVKNYVNLVLYRKWLPSKNSSHILDFFQTEIAVLVYQKSPTVLFNKNHQGEWFYPLKSQGAEYFDILWALDEPRYKYVDFELDEGL